jgi:hypothetical protein
MTTLSPAQQEAQRQAQHALREVQSYQRMLPVNYRHHGGGGMCRADGWDVSIRQLDGDYDLDDVLAQQIVASALGSTVSGITPHTGAASAANTPTDTDWLKAYLTGDPAGTRMSVDRLLSEGKNATAGPGNILANANEVKKAINAAVDKRTSDALQAAVRAMKPGASTSIKINQYMTLYNGNKTGKGRPRPRLRISGLPMQVITPALGEGARMAAQYGSASARALGTSALEAQRLGKFAAGQHWSKAATYMNGGWGGAALTFVPSAAIDLYGSIEPDLSGELGVNWRKFGAASAKSQTGNFVGWGLGVVAGGIAVVGFGMAGAPVILVSLGVGVFAQIIWGATGMSDLAGSEAKRALGIGM